mgnify:CR=1 FL=1
MIASRAVLIAFLAAAPAYAEDYTCTPDEVCLSQQGCMAPPVSGAFALSIKAETAELVPPGGVEGNRFDRILPTPTNMVFDGLWRGEARSFTRSFSLLRARDFVYFSTLEWLADDPPPALGMLLRGTCGEVGS